MHRIIVALLTTVDAAIAVAVGLAATLAPLTLLWIFGMGGAADWSALWPAGAAIWQLGHLVPLHITLPPEYFGPAGIDPAAASFVLSLAPLAFASFTAIFAARSGVRASRADAWITGVVTGGVVFAALTAGIALTSSNPIAVAERWQAILLPSLVFVVPALVGAVVTEWREASVGVVARLRDRVEAGPHGWGEAPALIARGGAVVVAGLIGVGAALTGVALFARAGQVVALFQAGNVDAIGATVLTIAQLAYLPTLVVWGVSFVAGPGFAVGEGTAVSPAATQVGVVPGLPVLGAVPESTTSWLLLLALLPVALGALAGWIARSRLIGPRAGKRTPQPVAAPAPAASRFDAGKTSALSGLLSASAVVTPVEPVADAGAEAHPRVQDEPIGARLTIAAGIAVVAAGVAALLAAVASGSLGPGRLAVFGPEPGPVALAIGAEVFVGAAILLLSPTGRARRGAAGRRDTEESLDAGRARAEPSGSGLIAGTWATWDDEAERPEAEGVPDAGELQVEASVSQRIAAAWQHDDEEEADAPADAAPTPEAPASESRTEPIDLPPYAPPGTADGSE